MARWSVMVVCTLFGCGRGPLWFPVGQDVEEATGEVDCDRADFVFVIDDSPSMQPYQSELVENFPVFIDGVERVIAEGTDLHVGVITTDAYSGNPEPCDVRGAFVTATTGAHSSRSQCGPYAAGASYMTAADDLTETFACAATVGTQGGQVETPTASLLDAIDPKSDAAACNRGFLRDDALLVAVILTDEADQSAGSPKTWAREVADAKGGNSEAVVVVSLTRFDEECDETDEHFCYPWALRSFTDEFEHAFIDNIAGDYSASFDRAVDVVAAACAGLD